MGGKPFQGRTARLATTVAAALITALCVVPAAQAVSHKQAERKALKALEVKRGNDPVIVFRLDHTLRPGARIGQAGTDRMPGAGRGPRGPRVDAATGVVSARTPVDGALRLRGERAYFFYADLGPFQTFQHPGRVALVGRRSGRVRVSERLMWPPLIDGRLPAFMRSAEAYHDRDDWAFYRPWREQATARAAENRGPIGLPMLDPPLVDMPLRGRAADLLAAERACSLRFSDTLGDFYDFGAVDRTRGWIGATFRRLEDLNPGFVDERYVLSSDMTPMAFAEDVIAGRGCRTVLVYLAGGAWADGPSAVTIGIKPAGARRLRQQHVAARQVRSLLRAHRDLRFMVIVDAPYAGGFADRLSGEGNALVVATPAASRGRTFSYLPEVEMPGGQLRRHPGNPHGLLEFTNRALFGLERFLGSAAEIEQAAAQQAGGASFLAWMITRAFALGAGEAPRTDTPLPPLPPPAPPVNRPPAAAGGSVPTAEDTPVNITLRASDPDGDPLAYSIADGPDDGTLTGSGAQRTYTPDADFHGSDAFAFAVADGRGGTSQARVTIRVTPVNDAPQVTTSAGSASFTEGGAPVAVDPGLAVDDVDDTEIEGVTATIDAAGAEDTLLFTDQNGITGTYAAGTLTLTGTASVAQYQAALRSVTYEHTGDDPPAARTIAFMLDDGDDAGAPGAREVAITPVNDAPTVATSAGSASFTEGALPVAVDPGVVVADVDSALLSAATVDLGSSFTSGEDVLGFTDQSGITGTYDAGTGLLTLSGTATVADYQAALRSVTYENTSNNPSTATRTAAFEVTDAGGLPSSAATRDVTVGGANDPPVLPTTRPILAYTEGDPAVVINGAITVTDADDTDLEGAAVLLSAGFESGDELLFTNQNGITGAYDAGTGVLTLTGTSSVANYQTALRSIQYRHTGDDPHGPKTVDFTADDGTSDSAPSRVDIEITAVNDAPVLDTTNAALTYPENAGFVAADPGVTLTDPDSTQIQGATVQITSNFVPAQDELAFTNQMGVTGAYDDVTGTLTLSGTASPASYQAALRAVTYENESDDPNPPTRTLTFHATDAEGAASTPATRDITLGAANDAASITTTAAPLAYTEGGPATAVDSALTVSDPDDANLEGALVSVSAGFEGGDELLFTNQNGITGAYNAGTGVLTLTGTGSVANYQTALRSVQYRHTGDNPTTVKTVEFRADDGDGLGPASVRNISVTRVNDAPALTTTVANLAYTENAGPVAIDDGLTVADPDSAELSGATVAISGNFQPAQDELAFVDTAAISGAYNDTTGVLTLSGTATVAQYQAALRSVTYENVSEGPTPLTRTVTFQATDSDGAASTAATRGIAINAVNDPPTAVNDTGTTDEDTTLNVAAPGVLANDTDVDPGDTKAVDRLNGSATLTGTSTKGASVTINANGSYTYNPGAVFQGLSTGQEDTDSFTYRMSDGGGASSTATVNLTITGISDAPVANADSFDAIGNTALSVGTSRPTGEAGKVITGSVLTNDTDVDTPQANLVAVAETKGTTLGGTITIEADGNFTYHPDDSDVGVTDTVQYTVSDGVASSNGTLNLPLAGQVWYVQNDEPAGGDGTSDTPFDTLAEAESASGTGDTVYVFDGDNGSVDLDTGYVIEANERLVGEHNGVSLSGHLLHAGTTSAHPTLTAAGEDVVAMASGSTLDGFNLDPSGTGGGISGGTGMVTINDVNVTDGGTAGTQPGVELDGTGTATITDLTVSTNGATGVRLNGGAATFTPASTITIASSGAKGLDATGTNLGTSTFDSITVTGSGAGGVSLSGTTGTTTFGDLSLTTTGGTGFLLSSAGTVTVPTGGTANVNATGGPAIDATGTSGATLAFDAVSSTNSASDGINLAGLNGGTFSATGGTIAGAAGIAFDLDGGSGAITYPGNINDGTGQTAEITGRSPGGVVTLNGAIADGADAGGGISLSGNTGGSTTFGNASKVLNTTTSNAVSFTNSDGHSLSLTGGGLDIDTTSGQGLVATTSGTLVVAGAVNSVTSTTGRAVNVQNTDFGASGFTFQSVSSNGAPNGILLNNTGTSAGMSITGTGANNSGGTIQNASEHGVSLTTTNSFNADELSVTGANLAGVDGTDVTNFTFTDGEIVGAGDSLTNDLHAAFAFNDLGANNVDGQLTLTGNTVTNPYGGGVQVRNASGTISQATVSSNTFQSTTDPATSKQDGVSFHIEGRPTTAAGLTQAAISGNSIVNFPSGNGVELVGEQITSTTGPRASFGVPDSTTNRIVVSGNEIRGNATNKMGVFGVAASVTGMADGNVRIANNGTAGVPMQNILGEGIGVGASGTANADFVIEDNVVAPGNVLGNVGISANANRRDVGGTLVATPDVNTTIQDNTVSNTSGAGIKVLHFNSNGNLRAKIINNTVAAPIQPNPGIAVENGSSNDPVFNPTLCAQISGNPATGSGPDGFGNTFPGIDLIERGGSNTTYRLQLHALTPNPATAAQTETFLAGQNPASSLGGGFYAGKRASVSEGNQFEPCTITF